MRTLEIILSVIIILIFIGCTQTEHVNDSDDWYSQKKINDSIVDETAEWEVFADDNYSIKYPDNWFLLNKKDSVVQFYLYEKNTFNDSIRENINMIIINLDGKSFEQFNEESNEQIKKNESLKLIENNKVNSNGINGHRIVFTKNDVKLVQYSWLKDEKVYLFTLLCGFDQYEINGEVAEKIMSSIKFDKLNTTLNKKH